MGEQNDSISNDHHFRILFNNDPLGSKTRQYGDGQRFFSMKAILFSLTGSRSEQNQFYLLQKRLHDYAALN